MDAGDLLRGGIEYPPSTEQWVCLVDIVQQMWRTGEIPKELRYTILVLISRGFTDTRGISLLETLCKVV